MTEMSVWDRISKRIGVSRAERMYLHYLAIEGELAPRGKGERAESEFFQSTFKKYYHKTRRLIGLRLIFYLFLYASFAINLFKAIPVLSFLVGFIELGTALFNTILLFAFVLFLTMKINLNLELMNESLTHLIALYHKNSKRKTDRVLRAIKKTL